MNAAAKLAGFAAASAIVFGAAALAGGAVEPVHHPARKAGAEMAGMGAEAPDAAPVRGLAVSDDGLTLQLAHATARPGKRFRLAFRIAGRDGRAVRDFDVEHTKRMHLIVVRRDMAGFQHLHPTEGRDGTWTVPVTLPDAGAYRVFADFSANGRAHTLAGDLQLDGAVRSRPLPAAATSTNVDGLRVRLGEGPARAGAESSLRFTVTRNGRPVAVQDYLGAKGHLVALRQGDLAYLHVHPDARSLRFMAEFPSAGTYRLFLQFRVDGRVHTAAFTQEVAR
jgi:hypothetical protein